MSSWCTVNYPNSPLLNQADVSNFSEALYFFFFTHGKACGGCRIPPALPCPALPMPGWVSETWPWGSCGMLGAPWHKQVLFFAFFCEF